jgi:hypothetical protein
MTEETNKLRLVLNVTIDYNLDGADPEQLRRNLSTMVQYAAGEGMLTGDSAATVETLDWKVVGRDRPLRERDDAGITEPAALAEWALLLDDDAAILLDNHKPSLVVFGKESRIYYNLASFGLETGEHTPGEE